MRVTYKPNEKFELHLEGNQKEIFADLHSFQEVFEHDRCGKCKKNNKPGKNIRFVTRQAVDGKKTFDYYELRCSDCGAKFKFGILNDGSDNLFPKTKDDEGNFLPDGGWLKWNRETNKEE